MARGVDKFDLMNIVFLIPSNKGGIARQEPCLIVKLFATIINIFLSYSVIGFSQRSTVPLP